MQFPMFTRHLRNADHTRRYSIAETSAGWEVRKELDSQVIRRVEYHRLAPRRTRARRSITLEVHELEAAGWRRSNAAGLFDEAVAEADDRFDLLAGLASLPRSRPTWTSTERVSISRS